MTDPGVALSPALQSLVARFAEMMRRVGARYGLGAADIDELVQEVRIRLWRSRPAPEDERLRTLGHAMSCPACGRELDLLRAVHAVRTTGATPMRRAAPFAIAATLVLIAGIALATRARSLADVDRFRSSDEVSPVAPRGTVPDSGTLTIVWHRVPGAIGYEVNVVAEDGARLARRTTEDTTVSLGVPRAPSSARTASGS